MAGMVKVTGPLPVPLAGEALKPDAVHVQAAFDVETLTVATPPPAGAAMLGGLMASEQVEPNCVIE